jgi:hypothetical protein
LRLGYLTGAFDSLTLLFEEKEEQMFGWHYNNCIRAAKMTNVQLAANVLAFARDILKLLVG